MFIDLSGESENHAISQDAFLAKPCGGCPSSLLSLLWD
jgi:hypothetical protein